MSLVDDHKSMDFFGIWLSVLPEGATSQVHVLRSSEADSGIPGWRNILWRFINSLSPSIIADTDWCSSIEALWPVRLPSRRTLGADLDVEEQSYHVTRRAILIRAELRPATHSL